MSVYRELLNKKVDVSNVKQDFKELVFELVSCMCDNVSYIRIKTIDNKISISHFNDHCSLALSNLQMKECFKVDLEWAFEDRNINELISIINSGTSKIRSIKSR